MNIDINELFERKEVTIRKKSFSIHELSVKDRRDVLALLDDKPDNSTISATMVLLGCYEFEGMELADVEALPGRVLDELSEKIADISGMSPNREDDDDDKAKKPEKS